MQRKVLVLGSSGRFGRHAARAFDEAGWEVVRHRRGHDNLWDSAWGASVIVNAWNPPYPRWQADVPELTRQVIEVASASGATVIIPGNVYVYGSQSPELLSAGTPHQATNPLGRIRIEMEAAYRDAGVRTIILRAGDFIDTEASGNWFDKVIAAGASAGYLRYPGAPDVPHAWAFLPDMARVAVALAEQRDSLSLFHEVPFEGFTLSGRELAQAVATAVARPVQLRCMGWWPLRLLAPLWPMARHLLEMRYLWDMPHRLDRTRLTALVPGFRPTPVAEAMALALEHQIDPDKPVPRRRGDRRSHGVAGRRPQNA